MPDFKFRLIEALGSIACLATAALLAGYFRLLRPKITIAVAMSGFLVGAFLTLAAVLPDNDVFAPVFSRGATEEKVIALTFDDGPYQPYTGTLLDVLAEKKVAATFFVIGENASRHPELLQRMVREGHQVANHTYHHFDLLKLGRSEVGRELDATSQVIEAATGVKPTAIRPPHGFRDPAVLEAAYERKLSVVQWSVMSRDWTNPGVKEIVERTLRQVRSGSIILLHDGDGVASEAARAQSVEAAGMIIETLQAQGYRFVTVDEMQRLKNGGKEE